MRTNNTSPTTQESSLDADCGINKFESDGCGDHDDAHPIQVHRAGITESMFGSTTVPGACATVGNHDYDRPPFGSSLAYNSLPNLHISDANCDEELPFPVVMATRLSYISGALIPTHYIHVPTNGPEGKQNHDDAVPSNAAVRPAPSAMEIQAEDSNSNMVAEETQNPSPPCYATVQIDAVPPCSDATTALVPNRLGAGIPILTDSDTISDARKSIDDYYLGSFICFSSGVLITFFWGIFGFFIARLFPWRTAKLGSIVGLGLMLIHYGTYSPAATDTQIAVTDNKPPAVGNDTTTDDPARSIMGVVLDAACQWDMGSFLLGAIGFISLFNFWITDESYKLNLLALNAHKPEQAPAEEHERMSPGSESLAGPTPQGVEHTEAVNLPAGV